MSLSVDELLDTALLIVHIVHIANNVLKESPHIRVSYKSLHMSLLLTSNMSRLLQNIISNVNNMGN